MVALTIEIFFISLLIAISGSLVWRTFIILYETFILQYHEPCWAFLKIIFASIPWYSFLPAHISPSSSPQPINQQKSPQPCILPPIAYLMLQLYPNIRNIHYCVTQYNCVYIDTRILDTVMYQRAFTSNGKPFRKHRVKFICTCREIFCSLYSRMFSIKRETAAWTVEL